MVSEIFPNQDKDKAKLKEDLIAAINHARRVLDTAKAQGLLPIGITVEEVPDELIQQFGWMQFANNLTMVMMKSAEMKNPDNTMKPQNKNQKPNRHLRRVAESTKGH